MSTEKKDYDWPTIQESLLMNAPKMHQHSPSNSSLSDLVVGLMSSISIPPPPPPSVSAWIPDSASDECDHIEWEMITIGDEDLNEFSNKSDNTNNIADDEGRSVYDTDEQFIILTTENHVTTSDLRDVKEVVATKEIRANEEEDDHDSKGLFMLEGDQVTLSIGDCDSVTLISIPSIDMNEGISELYSMTSSSNTYSLGGSNHPTFKQILVSKHDGKNFSLADESNNKEKKDTSHVKCGVMTKYPDGVIEEPYLLPRGGMMMEAGGARKKKKTGIGINIEKYGDIHVAAIEEGGKEVKGKGVSSNSANSHENMDDTKEDISLDYYYQKEKGEISNMKRKKKRPDELRRIKNSQMMKELNRKRKEENEGIGNKTGFEISVSKKKNSKKNTGRKNRRFWTLEIKEEECSGKGM